MRHTILIMPRASVLPTLLPEEKHIRVWQDGLKIACGVKIQLTFAAAKGRWPKQGERLLVRYAGHAESAHDPGTKGLSRRNRLQTGARGLRSFSLRVHKGCAL